HLHTIYQQRNRGRGDHVASRDRGELTHFDYRLALDCEHGISHRHQVGIRDPFPVIAELFDPLHDLLHLVVICRIVHLVQGRLDRSGTGMLAKYDTTLAANLFGLYRFIRGWLADYAVGMDAAFVRKGHLAYNCLVHREWYARMPGDEA